MKCLVFIPLLNILGFAEMSNGSDTLALQYARTDSSLDFSKVDQSSIRFKPDRNRRNSDPSNKPINQKQLHIGFAKDIHANGANVFYSLLGERISGLSLSKLTGLVIYK